MKKKIYTLLSIVFTVLFSVCLNAQTDTTGPGLPSGSDASNLILSILAACDVNCPVWLKVLLPMALGAVLKWLQHRNERKQIAATLKGTMQANEGDLPSAHENALQRLIDKIERKKK